MRDNRINIDFDFQRWEKVKQAAGKWWKGELERPLIQVRLQGHKPARPEPELPFYRFASFYDIDIPVEKIVDRWDYSLCCTKFMGDAFPTVFPNFGPGVIAAFMGATLQNSDDTVWFHYDRKPIADIEFKHTCDVPWLDRIKDCLAAARQRWQGLVQIGQTDLGGNLDIVASMCNCEDLMLAMYEQPEQVDKLVWQSHDLWWRYFEEINAVCQSTNPGYTSWDNIFSEQSYFMLQCDFCCMIGPEHFERFALPELTATAGRLSNAFFHLDGPGAIKHLDSILEIEGIKGVQWIPGAGQPDILHWLDVFEKIHNAGKLIQIFNGYFPKDMQTSQVIDKLGERLGNLNNIVFMFNGNISQEKEYRALLSKFNTI